jgi:hypothetical protein
MDEPFFVPYLKAHPEMGQHVQPMRGFYCRIVMAVLDVTRRIDVFAVIEKVHAVEGHFRIRLEFDIASVRWARAAAISTDVSPLV